MNVETCFADGALARRLEATERDANAQFVEARTLVDPSAGAAWIDVDGTYAMYDGQESPCTQTFGFGLFAAPTASALDTIERFFLERGAPVFHEVCPIADPAHLPLLNERGYRPLEFSNVMYRPLTANAQTATAQGVAVRSVGAGERELWARTLAEGWSDQADVASLIGDLARVMATRADGALFLAEIGGRAVAAGAMFVANGVALLAGASTIPAVRGRGAQAALLAARLDAAVRGGCDLAMVVALPGSSSQRNAERNGFRVAYTRTKWELPR